MPTAREDVKLTDKDNHGATITRHAQTVVIAALEVRELVAAGLKFDATGYEATAWSIITFCLHV